MRSNRLASSDGSSSVAQAGAPEPGVQLFAAALLERRGRALGLDMEIDRDQLTAGIAGGLQAISIYRERLAIPAVP